MQTFHLSQCSSTPLMQTNLGKVCASFIAIQPFACEKKRFLWNDVMSIWRKVWPWPWAHHGCRLIWGPWCASLVAIQSSVWQKRFAQNVYRWTNRHTDTGRWHSSLRFGMSQKWATYSSGMVWVIIFLARSCLLSSSWHHLCGTQSHLGPVGMTIFANIFIPPRPDVPLV